MIYDAYDVFAWYYNIGMYRSVTVHPGTLCYLHHINYADDHLRDIGMTVLLPIGLILFGGSWMRAAASGAMAGFLGRCPHCRVHKQDAEVRGAMNGSE